MPMFREIGRSHATLPVRALGSLVAILACMCAMGAAPALAVGPVSAGAVVWANFGSGTIGRANLDGTGADESFITGASGPFGVAVDGS
jgi:hypothetical protein